MKKLVFVFLSLYLCSFYIVPIFDKINQIFGGISGVII